MNQPMKSVPVTGNYRSALDVRTISADDLEPGQEVTLTVAAVTKEEVHDKNGETDDATTMILSLRFEGTPKFLGIPSRTNSQAMAKIAGTGVVEKWVGVHVTLYRIEKMFFGRLGAIRLKKPTPEQEARAAASSARRRGELQEGAAAAMESAEDVEDAPAQASVARESGAPA